MILGQKSGEGGAKASIVRAGQPEPGVLLDGRFELADVICSGGMATIYKALDRERSGAVVAIKIPYREVEADPALYSRFQNEELIGSELEHPSILKFYPVKNKSRMYLVMEYLEGRTLFEALRERRTLPESEALPLAGQICDALRYLHERGILHRDLKPENVMLCSDGTLRLMDFGIARAPNAKRLTFLGFAPGTPHYMAPERVNGKRGDPRTDIYSLGAMLYEMLTGVIAFNDEDITVIMNSRITGDPDAPRRVNAGISPQAEEIILRAMERDPDKRYPTAAAMTADLDNPAGVHLTGRADRLEPSTPFKRRWLAIRMVLWWAVAPVIVQVLLFFWLWHHLKGRK